MRPSRYSDSAARMARAGVMPAPDAALMSAVVLNGAGGLSWRGSALYAVTSAVSTLGAGRSAVSMASCVSKRPLACATSNGSPSCSSVALSSQYGTGTNARRSSSRSTTRRRVGDCTRPTDR